MDQDKTSDSFRKRQEALESKIRDASSTDLVFMMDCSRSMRNHIKACKDQIVHIVMHCVDNYENKIRVGFVGYRDYFNQGQRIVIHELDENYSEVMQFLESVEAIGNQDICEDVFGGIESAANLQWRSPNRILVHIADAPQHGTRFHGPMSEFSNVDHYDSFNDADFRGLRIEDLIRRLKELKINYFFAKLNNSVDIMIKEFNRVAGKEDFIKEFDLKSTLDIFVMAAASIGVTVDEEVETILAIEGPKPVQEKSKDAQSSVTDMIQALSGRPSMSFKILYCHFTAECKAATIKNDLGKISQKWTDGMFKRADRPLAETPRQMTYFGLKDETDEKIVIKKLKLPNQHESRMDYISVMERQEVAVFLAQEFNRLIPPDTKKIAFLNLSILEGQNPDDSKTFYIYEKFLPNFKNQITTLCSKTGVVTKKVDVLEAFCHWTHEISGHYLMIADSQGEEYDNGFVLTDPTIHCKEDRFGEKNCGPTGMKGFFKTHTCNKICKALKLSASMFAPIRSFQKKVDKMMGKVSEHFKDMNGSK